MEISSYCEVLILSFKKGSLADVATTESNMTDSSGQAVYLR